jgi:thiol-disulfide isomerase/thioredoxin
MKKLGLIFIVLTLSCAKRESVQEIFSTPDEFLDIISRKNAGYQIRSYTARLTHLNEHQSDIVKEFHGEVKLIRKTDDPNWGFYLHSTFNSVMDSAEYFYDGNQATAVYHDTHEITIINVDEYPDEEIRHRRLFGFMANLLANNTCIIDDPRTYEHSFPYNLQFLQTETPDTVGIVFNFDSQLPRNQITYSYFYLRKTLELVRFEASFIDHDLKNWSKFEFSNWKYDEEVAEDDFYFFRVPEGYSATSEAPKTPLNNTEPNLLNQLAPNFTAKTSSGDFFELSKTRGKYVFLNFWESWCGICIHSIPEINNLQSKYKGNLEVIGITTMNPEIIKKIVSKKEVNYLTLLADEEILSPYHVRGRPTYILLDPNGKIIVHAPGNLSLIDEYLEKVIL